MALLRECFNMNMIIYRYALSPPSLVGREGGTTTSYVDSLFLYDATSLHSSRLLSTSGYTTYQVYVHCII